MSCAGARKLLAQQLDRVMRVWPIVGIVLLVGNLSIQVAGLVAWRGGHILAWATLAAVVLVAGAVLMANWWAGPLRMVQAIRSSQAILDPTQIYALTPWERVIWREAMLPQLRNQAAIAAANGLHDEAAQLHAHVERLESWERLGHIPRDDYPHDLLPYYHGTGGAL